VTNLGDVETEGWSVGIVDGANEIEGASLGGSLVVGRIDGTCDIDGTWEIDGMTLGAIVVIALYRIVASFML